MELHIQHSDNIQLATAAAFLRSDSSLLWLKEIDGWNIPVEDLECYLFPSTNLSTKPFGLFVIFKHPEKIKHINLLEPYGCIQKKLFIPVNARLMPEIDDEELRNLLMWKQQVFSPAVGFVGFEDKDQVKIETFFSYHESLVTDWSFAHPGLAPRPPFTEIQVLQPNAEELMDSIQKDIGQQDLNKIPIKPEDEQSAIEKIIDKTKFNLLKGLLSVFSSIDKKLPENNSSDNKINAGNFLQKAQSWLEQNIQELEKKRNNEIKRLLKLFDENTNEALQFAIPLDSPYLQRGSENKSSKLTRNPLQFNLGKLGGGNAVDGWDLSDHYNTLRNKYLDTAKKQIANKEFKKAAYVYAHLLGDFSSAANVLEQGGLYREAASLYKEHLHNITSAAQCLEKGGLLNEAIDLYKELNQYEKVGDLYHKLDQEKHAAAFYEKHASAKISSNDYLDAARVVDAKMHLTAMAKAILLQGWHSNYQSEPCLKNYFDIVLNTDPENTEKEVLKVYDASMSQPKKLMFLDVLEYINKKKNDEALAETTLAITYEIVHNEIDAGSGAALNSLKKFLPNDKLIGSDISRYSSTNKLKLTQSKAQQVLHLDQSVKWVKATWQRNQFLVIGIMNSRPQLARGNWYGNLEYYSWSSHVEAVTGFSFINAPYQNNTVILNVSKGLPVSRKHLHKNKYFSEAILVISPSWLQSTATQCVLNDNNEICRIDVLGEAITLHHYDLNGSLTDSLNCVFEHPRYAISLDLRATLVSHEKFYYTYSNKHFISISASGSIKSFEFNSIIRLFASSNAYASLLMVISTNKGCLVIKPENGEIKVDENNYFGTDLIPSIIVFMTPGRFVIAEKHKAVLFEMIDGSPKELKTFEAYSTIISVLPTASRHQFAIIEESGKVFMCDV